MGGVNFLNLEYFVLLVYRIFTGSNIDITQIPAQTISLMEQIAWVTLGLTLLFLILLVWIHMRLHGVMHAGWHKRGEEEGELKRKHELKPAKNPQWAHVQLLMRSGAESDWRRAIIEADIMLDTLLSERGYAGATLGDKLKGSNPLQFTTLDIAWQAHKVRNDIAHGGESFHLDEREARGTIDLYKRVFEEFDYL